MNCSPGDGGERTGARRRVTINAMAMQARPIADSRLATWPAVALLAVGLPATADKVDRSGYTLWHYPCPRGRAVALYLVKDNGHTWPGGGKGSRLGDTPSNALDATDVIWGFFKTHPK
jgi:poly(3-hydroxybutyrate) depolymerase